MKSVSGLTSAQCKYAVVLCALTPFASRNGIIQPMVRVPEQRYLAQTRREDMLSLQLAFARTLTA